MSLSTTFISQQEINQLSPADISIDAQRVRPCIKMAQDLHFKAILGKPYYDYLITAIDNSKPPLNIPLLPQDALLIQEMTPALVWWSIYYIDQRASKPLTSKGIQDRKDAISAYSSYVPIRRDDTELADTYTREFKIWFCDYVKANPLLYPLIDLDNCGCCCDGSNWSAPITPMPNSYNVKGRNFGKYNYGWHYGYRW